MVVKNTKSAIAQYLKTLRCHEMIFSAFELRFSFTFMCMFAMTLPMIIYLRDYLGFVHYWSDVCFIGKHFLPVLCKQCAGCLLSACKAFSACGTVLNSLDGRQRK